MLTESGDVDQFTNVARNTHEADINRIAAAGITLGCNPPDNDRFCPRRVEVYGLAHGASHQD